RLATGAVTGRRPTTCPREDHGTARSHATRPGPALRRRGARRPLVRCRGPAGGGWSRSRRWPRFGGRRRQPRPGAPRERTAADRSIAVVTSIVLGPAPPARRGARG